MKTLLIAEDNKIIREGMVTVLRAAGHNVLAFENGFDALDYLRGGAPPDLILLDMLMPVMDGWRFLEELRGLLPAAVLPVVIATGTILTREWAEANGCAGFVHKPIEPEPLLAEVRRCLCTEQPAGGAA